VLSKLAVGFATTIVVLKKMNWMIKVQRQNIEIKVSEYLIVSRGARIAFDIAPANAPLANSLTSLRPKIVCSELDGYKRNASNNQS